MLTVVGQAVFAIPEYADSKILAPLTVLLGFMFVQGIIANEMPPTEQTPYVAIYAVSCVLLSGMSCLVCAFCMWVTHVERPLPKWLKFILVDCISFILFPSRWVYVPDFVEFVILEIQAKVRISMLDLTLQPDIYNRGKQYLLNRKMSYLMLTQQTSGFRWLRCSTACLPLHTS